MLRLGVEKEVPKTKHTQVCFAESCLCVPHHSVVIPIENLAGVSWMFKASLCICGEQLGHLKEAMSFQ